MSQPLHILHLEDNPYDAELVRETLRGEGMEVAITAVDNHDSFLAAINQVQFDLILADFVLPSFSGQAALLLAQEKCPDVPFIFVSGAIGEEKAIENLKLGATDYVLKERLSRLVPAIRRSLREVEERRQRQQALAALAARAQQQAAVAELGQQALVNADLFQLMDKAAALIVQALQIEYSKVLQLLPDGKGLQLVAGAGWREGLVGQATVEAGLGSQAGYILLGHGPVIVTDLRSETRFQASALLREHHVISGVSVIIPGAERPFGALGAHSSRQRLFTEDDIHFLQSVAHVLATAIERKQREEQLHQSRNQLAAILEGITEGITVQAPDGRLIYANETAARLSGYPSAQALVDAPLTEFAQKFELLDENGQPFPFSQLPGRKALQGQRSDEVLLRFRELGNGNERWSVVSATPIFDKQGQVQFAVNIFRDVTERTLLYQAEKEARQQVEATAVRLASLQMVSTALAEALTPTEVVQAVLEQVIAILGATAGSVVLRSEQDDMLELVHAVGYTADTLKPWQRFPLNATAPIAVAARTGEPIFLESPAAAAAYPALLEQASRSGNQAWATIPLQVQGRTIGAMGLSFNRPQAFTREDRAFMLALGRQCAQALERARLFWEASRLNVELEQRVADRTRELAISNEQLQETNAMLEEEITNREQVEERLRRQAARTAALVRTAERLNAELDLNTVLAAVCEEAVQALNAVVGTVSLYDPKQDALVHAWDYGLTTPLAFREQVQAASYKQYESYFQPTAPVIVLPDIAQATDFPNSALYGSAGVRTLACAGLSRQGRPVGLLCIGTMGEIHNFSENELALLQGLANQAAVAIQNARLHQQVRAAREQLRRLTQQVVTTQEEERQRISRELHDEAGQALTALSISLELMQNNLPNDPTLLGQRLAEAASLTTQTMGQIRLLARDLRPPSLDMLGLDLTLEGFCREFAQRTGLNIHYTGATLPELPGSVSITFYRLLQESLTNIARHAQAQNVQVVLGYDGEKLSLLVADDGKGFEMARTATPTGLPVGNGLLGMRERLDLLGGSLEIESQPGQGTRLLAFVGIG